MIGALTRNSLEDKGHGSLFGITELLCLVDGGDDESALDYTWEHTFVLLIFKTSDEIPFESLSRSNENNKFPWGSGWQEIFVEKNKNCIRTHFYLKNSLTRMLHQNNYANFCTRISLGTRLTRLLLSFVCLNVFKEHYKFRVSETNYQRVEHMPQLVSSQV